MFHQCWGETKAQKCETRILARLVVKHATAVNIHHTRRHLQSILSTVYCLIWSIVNCLNCVLR